MVWGYYWSKAKPVLTVHSGDTVRMQTLSTCGPNDRLEDEGVKTADIPAYNQPIFDQVKDKGPGGHILTGPVEIAEAEPGDVLEVQILKIDIDAPFACNGFWRGPRIPAERLSLWAVEDHSAGSGEDDRRILRRGSTSRCIRFSAAWGMRRRTRPDGTIQRPPWMHAGNIDNKEMVAGTTLFIPVHAKGALFEAGDGHAGQGNGEVDITAMETFLTGTFRFRRAQGSASAVAAGGDANQLYQHGVQPRS